MAPKVYRGSIVLEILIVLLALLLIAVILVPDRIWKEEERLTNACRYNLNAIYEAEEYYFSHTDAYTDTLENLVAFVRNDSSLQTRKRIVELTNDLYGVLQNILEIPAIREILTISQSIKEINGDLRGSERYFRKYENLLQSKDEIMFQLTRFETSADFPVFTHAKIFVDSLNGLKDRISDLPLQKSALYAQRYIDSILVSLNHLEKQEVQDYWTDEYSRIFRFIQEINKTDIVRVSSVGDRLKKFIDRIKSSLKNFVAADFQKNLKMLADERHEFERVYQEFLDPKYFMVTRRYGLLVLSESESILLNLNQENFTCPDAGLPYLISIGKGKQLIMECPNLLNDFQNELIQIIEPLKNIRTLQYIEEIDAILDSTRNLMNAEKPYYRRNTDILLDAKEIMADMGNLGSARFYRYSRELMGLMDTLIIDPRLSTLKPLLENVLNPIDTLSTRIETGNVRDLEMKLTDLGKKIQRLDSSIARARFPRRYRGKISTYYTIYRSVLDVVEEMKATFNREEGWALHKAAMRLENALLQVIEGKKERVSVIFFKKHLNHGYIKNKKKSWEES